MAQLPKANHLLRQGVPIYVISLARATTRRHRICASLDLLGVEYVVIDAVDGRAMTDAERSAVTQPGLQIHAGAIGCYLSHLEAYRRLLASTAPAALILEDDARLSPRATHLLRQGFESLDWDYCFLDSDDHNDCGPVFYDRRDHVSIFHRIAAHRLSAGPQTTHAYLITRSAAERRLKHAFPVIKPIDLYDHLPYPIVFRAIVAPKLAWVSGDSLTSFTSNKTVDSDRLSLAWLRRSPLFYRIRDALRLKGWRRRRIAAKLVHEGVLATDASWLPLPSGREVIY